MECVRIIYKGTPVTNRAHSMPIDYYTEYDDRGFHDEDVNQVLKDFVYDLSLSCSRGNLVRR